MNTDDNPASQHILVSRFMKAIFQKRPTLPCHGITGDPEIVLDYIKTLLFK